MRRKLWTDESGATLTTELALLTSVTAAGVLTAAGDIRDGVQERSRRLAELIASAGGEAIVEPIEVDYEFDQCVVVSSVEELELERRRAER